MGTVLGPGGLSPKTTAHRGSHSARSMADFAAASGQDTCVGRHTDLFGTDRDDRDRQRLTARLRVLARRPACRPGSPAKIISRYRPHREGAMTMDLTCCAIAPYSALLDVAGACGTASARPDPLLLQRLHQAVHRPLRRRSCRWPRPRVRLPLQVPARHAHRLRHPGPGADGRGDRGPASSRSGASTKASERPLWGPHRFVPYRFVLVAGNAPGRPESQSGAHAFQSRTLGAHQATHRRLYIFFIRL